MRLRLLPSFIAPALALALCACGQAGDGAGNSAAANVADSRADEVTATARPEARQPPRSSSQAAEPPAGLSLSAAPAQASEGATMTLTLTNGSDERIGYNLCSSGLHTGDGRPVPTANVCTMELRTLEPGRSADYRYRLPVNMVGGSYRFVTQVEGMESGRRSSVQSNSFTVG